jgi:hypothetical protein
VAHKLLSAITTKQPGYFKSNPALKEKIMKHLTLAIFNLLLLNPAWAEIITVQNGVWSTGLEPEQTLAFKHTNFNLSSECEEYREFIQEGLSRSSLDAESIESFRSVSESLSGKVFSAKFRLHEDATRKLLASSLERARDEFWRAPPAAAYPYALKNASFLEPLVSGVMNSTWNLSPHSLLGISKKFGLSPYPVTFTGAGLYLSIEVFGRDAVCDLVSQQSALMLFGQSDAKLSVEDFSSGDKFFKSIETSYAASEAIQKNILPKAAMFGFYLGSEMTRQEWVIGEDAAINSLVNIADKFFDENFKPNHYWSSFNGKKFLSYPVSASTSSISYQVEVLK